MTSSSGTALLLRKTSGPQLKSTWRLKYQDFLPEKNSECELFQKVVDRANDWLLRTPEVQVRTCETVTWTSHESKRLVDGEQMLLTQNVEENGLTQCVRGLRLWVVPSVSSNPETLQFTDILPTTGNDVKGLVIKVNRKLFQNQIPGEIVRVESLLVPHIRGRLEPEFTRWSENSADDKLYDFSLRIFTLQPEGQRSSKYKQLHQVSLEVKDFIPMPLEGDAYEGFEMLTERANTWMKKANNILHASFQSILVQKAEGRPHEEIASTCRFSIPGTNSCPWMEVFRVLRVALVTTSSAAGVENRLVPDPSAFRPFTYDVFAPEIIQRRSSATDNKESETDAEKMKDTFAKVMVYLKNTGSEVICAETVINPIQVDYESKHISSTDIIPFLLTLRLYLMSQSAARLQRRRTMRRGAINAASDPTDGPPVAADPDGPDSHPIFLSSVVSKHFKYRWLVIALCAFSGMSVIVALSVIYSNTSL